jgi:hypothetical protein
MKNPGVSLDMIRGMWRFRYQMLVILLVTGVVYANSLRNSFVMDDSSLVVANPRVHSLMNIPKMFLGSAFFDPTKPDESGGQFYRPVASVTYAFLYALGGKTPGVYHLFQIVLQAINAMLVVWILRRFVKPGWAFWAGLVFAIHPLNQMTTAYISQLNDGLYLCFGFLAMIVVMGKRWRWREQLLVSGLLILSILAKETGVLFVVTVVGYGLIFKKPAMGKFVYVLAYFLTGYLFLRFVVAKVTYVMIPDIPIMRATLPERLMTMPKIGWYYLKTFLWPHKLVATQWWMVRNFSWEDFWGPVTGLMLVAVALGKGGIKYGKNFWFWTGWIGLGMGLHSQLWPLDWTVLDPWFGFAMVGWLALIGMVGNEFKWGKKFKLGGVILGMAIVVALGFRTMLRNFDWKNGITLFTHDLKYEDNGYMRGALGGELMAAGRYQEAIPQLKKALELNAWGTPNWYNLGYADEKIGNFSMARENYGKFLSIMETDFGYESLLMMDLKYLGVGTESGLIANKAVEKYPNDSRLRLISGIVKYKLGDITGARAEVNRSYEISPSDDAVYVLQKIEKSEPLDLGY